MKIVHIYKTFLNNTFGGVEQTIFQIAKANNEKFSHSVVSLANKKQEGMHLGIKTITYKQSFSIASNSVSLSLLWDFQKIVQKADLIHYHFPWPFADILHLFWRVRKPSIITYHSDIIRQQQLLYMYRPLMRRFLDSMDRIVATSPNYLASSKILQNYKNKVVTIPIGLDKSDYPTPSSQQYQHWRQRLGTRFFLFIGVLRYYKGLHVLLDALQGTDFPMVIVGSGPLEQELKKNAAQLKLPQLHFLGRLADPDKVALLSLCLALVFPSHLRSEAFGLSLLEGAMAGKPLISTEMGTGTSYINIHGETGFVIPPQDPIALRQAMQWIWDDPVASVTMGKKAAARYQELFTGEKMVSQYEKMYQEVIHQ